LISLREQLLHLQNLGFDQSDERGTMESNNHDRRKDRREDGNSVRQATDEGNRAPCGHPSRDPEEGGDVRTSHGASASDQRSPHEHQAEDQQRHDIKRKSVASLSQTDDEQLCQKVGQKKAKTTVNQGNRPGDWSEAEELLKTLPLLALLSPRHIIEIEATYLRLTCKGTSISSDDPFVTRAERLLLRLGRACSLNPGSLAGGMTVDTSYARTVSLRLGARTWDPLKSKETSLFGFGPVPQQSPVTKIRIPRLSETKLVSDEEDCVPLHEVQRELTAFRRIAGTILGDHDHDHDHDRDRDRETIIQM
jgi:hypothetical protein